MVPYHLRIFPVPGRSKRIRAMKLSELLYFNGIVIHSLNFTLNAYLYRPRADKLASALNDPDEVQAFEDGKKLRFNDDDAPSIAAIFHHPHIMEQFRKGDCGRVVKNKKKHYSPKGKAGALPQNLYM